MTLNSSSFILHLHQDESYETNEFEAAERAIFALNRAGFDAVDGSLDDSMAGVSELEGAPFSQ